MKPFDIDNLKQCNEIYS